MARLKPRPFKATGPAAVGALTASLSFADNAFGLPQLVALSGTGVAPAPVAKLSAQTLSFNSTKVGATNTAYYYQVVVTTAGGTTAGPVQRFITN